MTADTPQTEAGRRLGSEWGGDRHLTTCPRWGGRTDAICNCGLPDAILAIEAEARAAGLREAPLDARLGDAIELAKIAARNWHLVRYPDHGHDLADECPEPVFVRLYAGLAALAAPESPR